MTDKGGRPKGYTPGLKRNITHQIGQWSWNSNLLHSHIEKKTQNECWIWNGSKGPQANLFGAYKNGHQQMTQVNRLLQMELTNAPLDGYKVSMKCKNRYCSNPHHFEVNPLPGQIPVTTTEWTEPAYTITISEHAFLEITNEQRLKIKEMATQHAETTGIDWEYQYRWMTMTKPDYMLAKLKYDDILKYMTVRAR